MSLKYELKMEVCQEMFDCFMAEFKESNQLEFSIYFWRDFASKYTNRKLKDMEAMDMLVGYENAGMISYASMMHWKPKT